MAAEDFFTRWAKKKGDAAETPEVDVAASESKLDPCEASVNEDVGTVADVVPKPLATQADLDMLTPDSDYSAFMAQGVDESVKRSAMKKLFSNPHFNIMDGLDIYIDDYSKFEPISPALLASLSHAKNLLDPLSQLEAPLMSLLDAPKKTEQHDAQAATPELLDEPEAVEQISAIENSEIESTEVKVESEEIPAASQEPQKNDLPESGVTHNAKDI